MLWLFPIAAFLVGSVPFGILIARSKGVDIRRHGSGNIGATNVFRTIGKGPGSLCLLLDVLKGFLPVVLATNLARIEGSPPAVALSFLHHLGATFPAGQQAPLHTMQVVTALAAILGHNFSPWIGFRGGKGIATSAGAVAGLMPFVLLAALAVFLVTLLLSRIVSLGSILAALALPLFTHLSFRLRHAGGDPSNPTLWEDGSWNKPLFAFSLLAGLLAVWRHRSNISRLLKGSESRLSGSKAKTNDP